MKKVKKRLIKTILIYLLIFVIGLNLGYFIGHISPSFSPPFEEFYFQNYNQQEGYGSDFSSYNSQQEEEFNQYMGGSEFSGADSFSEFDNAFSNISFIPPSAMEQESCESFGMLSLKPNGNYPAYIYNTEEVPFGGVQVIEEPEQLSIKTSDGSSLSCWNQVGTFVSCPFTLDKDGSISQFSISTPVKGCVITPPMDLLMSLQYNPSSINSGVCFREEKTFSPYEWNIIKNVYLNLANPSIEIRGERATLSIKADLINEEVHVFFNWCF